MRTIAPTITASGRQLAWDCGTGNGQAALELVKHFNRVVATDTSSDQLAQAVSHERIDYRVERAEDVSLETGSVDLVTDRSGGCPLVRLGAILSGRSARRRRKWAPRCLDVPSARDRPLDWSSKEKSYGFWFTSAAHGFRRQPIHA